MGKCSLSIQTLFLSLLSFFSRKLFWRIPISFGTKGLSTPWKNFTDVINFANYFPTYVMKKIAAVHRGKVITIIKYYRLSHDVVTSGCKLLFPKRKSTCHLFLFLMVILNLFCRKSPKPGNQTLTKGPRPSSNPPRFCLTSKVCPNSFAAAYNYKACALFSSRKLR